MIFQLCKSNDMQQRTKCIAMHRKQSNFYQTVQTQSTLRRPNWPKGTYLNDVKSFRGEVSKVGISYIKASEVSHLLIS